jgi:phosphoribosyl-AMP cyclohydrolase/RimJ/RimL family protein N-acetyltransferase
LTILPRRPIETDRLVLEPASVAHAPAMSLASRTSRENLVRWMVWARTTSLEGVLANISSAEARWTAGSAYCFAITADGAVVGRIDIRRTENHPAEGNLGYWLSDAAAGKGYMSEAVAAVLEFGFAELGLGRVELRAHVANTGSQRVAEKAGMRREELVRGGTWLEGPEDAYLYGMIATDPRRDTRTSAAAQPGGEPLIVEPDFSRGLLTAVAQDGADRALLMVAHMNEEAYRRTLDSGHAWFWSRSRERLWEKGETSGNHLVVDTVTLDCDGDAVLLEVTPAGPACHTGARTCFHHPVVRLREPGAIAGQPPRKPRSRKSQQ